MKAGDFFTKFNDDYPRTFQKCRLVSQTPIFIIAVITVCETGQDIYLISQEENIGAEAWEGIKRAQTFLFFITAVLSSRFLLLFSVSKSAFWLSQIIWLAGFLTLCSSAADLTQGGCTKNLFPMAGETLSYFYAMYMVGSPVHQFFIFLISLFRIFTK